MHSLPLARDTPETIIRLSGRTLVVARSLWLVVSAATTLIFLFALPARWALLTHASPTTLANLLALGLTSAQYAAFALALDIVFAGVFTLTGLIIFWRCGNERFALFTALVLVLLGVGNGALNAITHSLIGLHPVLDLLIRTFGFMAWLGIALFFYLFPNGRFVPVWTRWLAVAIIPIYGLWNFAADTPLAPLNWPLWLLVPVNGSVWASWFFSQVYRYRRVSNAIERQQTKWVVFATALILGVGLLMYYVVGAFVPSYVFGSEDQATPQAFAFMLATWAIDSFLSLLLPVAIAFSIMRYRLWDIDTLISRAIVYGVLTGFVISAYAVVVGGWGALFQSSGNFLFSLVATGVIALLFNPLRVRLQRLVNRLMYGERDDPYGVLSRLGQKLEAALAPDSVLPTIVEAIAQTLKLPYAAIRLSDDTAATHGTWQFNVRPESFPLVYQGETIGQLEVAPRAADETFTADERRLLAGLAHQAGVAAHAARLTADLQRARERLVTAREEERRRLRRDLHDGLGPKLAGQALILEAVRDSLEMDSQNRALVDHLIEDSQTIVTEVRELVHGLRPPALDDFGLAGAVRALAAQCEPGRLRVTVSILDPLPPLPAAVEVAAYRIVQEAFTNVVKHARARSCTVSLVMDRDLRLEIRDDGRGLPPNRRAGVGLSSMRERAQEIGGSCVVEDGESGGTRVTATLPVANHQ